MTTYSKSELYENPQWYLSVRWIMHRIFTGVKRGEIDMVAFHDSFRARNPLIDYPMPRWPEGVRLTRPWLPEWHNPIWFGSRSSEYKPWWIEACVKWLEINEPQAIRE